MQNSGRFLGFDFERHFGNLSITQNPNFQEPRSEEYEGKFNAFLYAAKDRQDRYEARWEGACLTNTHDHDLIRLPPLRNIQRSSSSADHDAERSRRRLIQASGGGQETLPQTPIRGTPPMLGTFTSMSSPGGMGNLSYGGGVLFPKTHCKILRLALVTVEEDP